LDLIREIEPSVRPFENYRKTFEKIEAPTYKSLIAQMVMNDEKKSIFEIAWWLLKQTPTVIKIIYSFIQVVIMFQDKKTSISALVGLVLNVIGMILKFFGIEVPNEVFIAVNTIIVFLIGLFAKDSGNLKGA
jgi:uncharacterized membrane protein